MSLQNYIFLILFLAAVVLFIFNLVRIISYLKLGRPEKRTDHFFKRFKKVLTVGIGQSKILREPSAGLMHALIFWGFLCLLTAVIEAFVQGFYEPFTFASTGRVSRVIFFSQDIFGTIVIISVFYALIRRHIFHPKRLSGDGHTNRDATIILCLILGVMVTMFGVNATKAFVHPSYYEYYRFNFAASALTPLFTHSNAAVFYAIFWWAHVIIILCFLNYLPYSKHFHIVTSLPNVYLSNLGPQTLDTEEINFENENVFLGAGDAEQLTWKQMFDGYVCTECGRCTAACPANITGKPLSPRKIIMNIRERVTEKAPLLVSGKQLPPDIEKHRLVSEHYISAEELWACTTCMACIQECPVNIEHVGSIVDMRRFLVQSESQFPEELMTVFSNMENNGAPWAFPQSDRLLWAEGLNIPLASDRKEFDVLYWVGCAGAFDARYQRIPRAMAGLLNKAGVDYAVLGTEEKCNGDSARRLGNEFLAQTLIKENCETLKKYRFNSILVTCPHCLQTIGTEYKKFGAGFRVVHHSEFISRLIKEKKLELDDSKKINEAVTYHDSCYLGRYGGIYDEPRDLIRKTSINPPAEMERSRDRGLCCGAGGGRMWLEEKTGKKVNIERTEEALALNPGVISTACPFCMTMLSDGVKDKGRSEDVKIKDIAEIIGDAVK